MRILIFSLSIALATTSCGRVRVDGNHVGDYCVPKENAISNDWGLWEKNHAPSDRAFAFHGCTPDMDHCDIPKVITGGVVEPESKIDWSWDGIPKDAFYRQVLVEGTPSLGFLENSKYAVLSNPSLTQDWYIWQLPNNQSDDKTVIGSGARLMAVCRNSKASPSPKIEQFDHAVSCKRFVQAPNFGLFYDFTSATKSTIDFIELDTKIIQAVESWHCQNSPT